MRLPLALFRASPLTLALPLYGDTPRATIRTPTVRGTNDLFLVETEVQNGRRFTRFQRVERPERRVPAGLLAPITGFETTEPTQVSTLLVEVAIDGDEVVFDG